MLFATLISALLTALLASSCGKPREAAEQVDPFADLTLAENEEKISWQEPECLRGQLAGRALTETTIRVLDRPGGRDLKIDPTLLKLIDRYGLPSVSNLGGEFIARDIYRRRCINIGDDGDCLDSGASSVGWKPFSLGTPPRFCQIKQDYKPNSLENASLTIMYHYKKSRDFIVKNYFNEKAESLGQIDVKILPLFESIRPSSDDASKEVKTIEVNNVMYFPSFSSRQKPFLTFLPRSETLALDGKSEPLWQNSFVHAHELSHHLERKWELDQFNKSRSFARKALSEAFSDIVAFQATEWRLADRTLANSSCLSERGLDNKYFLDGSSKRLTTEMLTKFESSPKLNGQSSGLGDQWFWRMDQGPCPGISKTHYGLAAIYGAAFFDSIELMLTNSNLLDLSTQTQQNIYSYASKMFLTAAANSMKTGSGVRADTDIVLKSLESAMIETAKRFDINLNSSVRRNMCKNMNSYFPYQSNTSWFESENCNETSL